jgi:hypothetical protein
MATASKSGTIEGLRSKATADWRDWAHALASTGKLPATRDLVDAAGLLGRTVDDLERDASIISKYNAEVAESQFWKGKLDEIEAERGSIEEVRQMIAQAEEQVERLREMERAGHSEGWRLGTAKATIDRIRKSRPDLFGDA